MVSAIIFTFRQEFIEEVKKFAARPENKVVNAFFKHASSMANKEVIVYYMRDYEISAIDQNNNLDNILAMIPLNPKVYRLDVIKTSGKNDVLMNIGELQDTIHRIKINFDFVHENI